LSALIAYWDDRDLLVPERVHRAVIGQRQHAPVERDGAAHVAHAAVQPDQALAERRLAAAGLAREPHDLAVVDFERDAVERPDVAAERAVVHGQVIDAEAHLTAP
jgi:hypothetical protein